jgi:hypothetical protein
VNTPSSQAHNTACPLNTKDRLGMTTWGTDFGPNPNKTTVWNCLGAAGAGWQSGGANGLFQAGSALTLPVEITDRSQTVSVALVLDNIETEPAVNLPGSNAGVVLGVAGNGLQGLGSGIALIPIFEGIEDASVLAAFTGFGAVAGAIGAGLSLIGILQPTTSGTLPGDHISCTGGMFARGDGTAADTMFVNLTAAQLETAAYTGAVLQYHSSGSWGKSHDGSLHCASDLTVHLKVTRDWTSGLAAAPRSGDFALMTAPNQSNVFVVPQTAPQGANSANQFVGVYGDKTSWVAPISTDKYGLYEGGVSAATTGAIVQTAPLNRANNAYVDTFLFWADANGSLHKRGFDHPMKVSYDSPQTIFNQTYQSRICTKGPLGTICGPPTTKNLLPANAEIAAVSRGATFLDVFFIDAQGDLWDVHSIDGGGVWTSTQITTDHAGVPGGAVSAVAKTGLSLDVLFLGNNGLAHASEAPSTSKSCANPTAGWCYETVGNTGGLGVPGGHLAAVAQTVTDLDVFFVDTKGHLWRAWSSQPTQPSLLVYQVSPNVANGVPDGFPGGPIAAVSRQPGHVDVVFRPWLNNYGPTWYSFNQGSPTMSHMPGIDASKAISIVAPSSYALRVFVENAWSNVYTADYAYAGRPSWTSWFGVETLTPES